jgi:hypothetical protein
MLGLHQQKTPAEKQRFRYIFELSFKLQANCQLGILQQGQ